jgi:predicted PurR-regulated permease PerM
MSQLELIAGNVVRYLGLKTLVSGLTGLLAGGLVAVVGVDFAVLWALLAFILNYIPTFGSIIAALPPVLLALIQFGGPAAIVVGVGYVAINFLIGSVLEPRLMGRSMGLSTLVVFVSLLAWGWILGTAGMFFAVPLTMALKIALESNPDARWLAVLMGPDPETKPEPSAEPGP